MKDTDSADNGAASAIQRERLRSGLAGTRADGGARGLLPFFASTALRWQSLVIALVAVVLYFGLYEHNRSRDELLEDCGDDSLQRIRPTLLVPADKVLSSSSSSSSSSFDKVYQQLWNSKHRFLKYQLVVPPSHQEEGNDTSSSHGDGSAYLRRKVIPSSPGGLEFLLQFVPGRATRPQFAPSPSSSCSSCSSSSKSIKAEDEKQLQQQQQQEEFVVVQPFDETQFNFNKVADPREILFVIRLLEEETKGGEAFRCLHQQKEVDKKQTPMDWREEWGVVVANKHPFDYGCTVIVYRPEMRLPQLITKDSLRLAFLLSLRTEEGLRIGYNSLEGGASVNHLHFQGWYLTPGSPPRFQPGDAPPLAIEQAPTRVLQKHPSGVELHETEDYPLRTLVYASHNTSTGASAILLDALFKCMDFLVKENVPHNLIFSPQAQRIFLVPRLASSKINSPYQQRFGFPEVAGHIIIVSEHLYDELNDWRAVWALLESIALPEELFARLSNTCTWFLNN